jgi:hypothetical protein
MREGGSKKAKKMIRKMSGRRRTDRKTKKERVRVQGSRSCMKTSRHGSQTVRMMEKLKKLDVQDDESPYGDGHRAEGWVVVRREHSCPALTL